MEIYNTLTKKIEHVVPIKDEEIRMYSCGPTVYDFAHIGNLRYFLEVDFLKRSLMLEGYKVIHVMNITDVGHLTSDADTGEDKIEKSAAKSNMSAWDLSRMYTNYFLDDLNSLNVMMPNVLCKATEHIQDMINMIKKLEEKGYTYKIDDGIYYDTSKFPKYGELLGKNFSELNKEILPGARVEFNPQKRNPTDFALWKFSPKDKKRQMEWDSPWGVGFPGWHIECSAMSTKYLGNHFDIHAGGVDLIFPHHTNEIAQSEAATGEKFVNYWFHVNHLLLNGRKMSKSEGNFLTLRDLTTKGYDPLAFRLFVFDHHYRNQVDFTFDKLDKYVKTLENFDLEIKMISSLPEYEEDEGLSFENYVQDFRLALSQDLNTNKAFQIFSKFMDKINDYIFIGKIGKKTKKNIIDSVKIFDSVIGVFREYEIPDEIIALAEKRRHFREAGIMKEADSIREEILSKGFKIIDTKNGYIIIKSRGP